MPVSTAEVCTLLVQRTDCKEYISLVSCSAWELRSRIAITTQDLADLAWSPDSSCFVVWDTMLTYKLLVYSSEGLCLASFSAYQDALGIRSLRFSPNGQMLAIGSFDQAWPLDLSSSQTCWRRAVHLCIDCLGVRIPQCSVLKI